MSGQGPSTLFLFTAIVEALLAAYVLYRIRVQASLEPPQKTGFDLGATAPVGGVVTTGIPDPQDPLVAVPQGYTREERPAAEDAGAPRREAKASE
jgi:hypothetical protein